MNPARPSPLAERALAAAARAAALGALLLAGCSSSGGGSGGSVMEAIAPSPAQSGPDDELVGTIALPPAPQPAGLAVFYVSPSGTRFAIDPASLAVVGKTMVAVTVVATSRSGVDNVTQEVYSCPRQAYQVLAFGRRDGSWSRVASPTWRLVDGPDVRNVHPKWLFDAFCSQERVSGTPAAMRERLRTSYRGAIDPRY